MRIQVFQHVSFEGIGSLATDIAKADDEIHYTHWYLGDQAPDLTHVDCLIVMGGPMGVHDEREFPWLTAEKNAIRTAINYGKKVLGICLGAQLIADVLGAKVAFNGHREIGWHKLYPQSQHPLTSLLCAPNTIFHWHGDTFDIPEGATWLVSSEGCKHQAYVLNERVFGFQFHLETTPESAKALIDHCGTDLDNSRFVQRANDILSNTAAFTEINATMSKVWAYIKNA